MRVHTITVEQKIMLDTLNQKNTLFEILYLG